MSIIAPDGDITQYLITGLPDEDDTWLPFPHSAASRWIVTGLNSGLFFFLPV
jgi:hypothetical protein